MKTWIKFQEALDLKGGLWVTLFSAFMLFACAVATYQTFVKKVKTDVPDGVKSIYFTVLGTFALSKSAQKIWAGEK